MQHVGAQRGGEVVLGEPVVEHEAVRHHRAALLGGAVLAGAVLGGAGREWCGGPQRGHPDAAGDGDQQGVVGNLPPGPFAVRFGGDEHAVGGRPVPERVAVAGGGDRAAVGEQEVEPGVGAGGRGLPYHGCQCRGGRFAAAQPVAEDRPQQGGVTACLQREQVRGAEPALRSQCGRQPGPVGDGPVVAEQPRPVAEGGGGRFVVGGSLGGRADGGQERPGADGAGEVGQVGVGPDRDRAPVAGRWLVRVRRVPAEAEPVRVHGAVPLPPGRPGLCVQAVRRAEQQGGGAGLRSEVGEMAAHQRASPGVTSRAVRKPLKICRRIGWSQLRKVPRQATGSTPNEPPRSTL